MMAKFLEAEPSELEFNLLLKTVDKDQDGKISWDDFLQSMKDWFSQDWKMKDIKRRKLNSQDERLEIHRNIKLFFSQFKPVKNFEQMRSKLVRAGSSVISRSKQEEIQMNWDIDQPESIVSSQDKVNELSKVEQVKFLSLL